MAVESTAYLHASTAAGETTTSGPAMLYGLDAWHANV